MTRNSARLAAWSIRATAGRGLYLIAIVLVAVAAWICISVLASPFVQPRGGAQIAGVFISSANQGVQLPLKYAARVEAIPGARFVAYVIGVPVVCKDSAAPVSINAFGGPGARKQALGITPTPAAEHQAAAWMKDPMGILIGSQVATNCGWQAGMGVAPKNAFTGKPVELHVIGVRPPQKNPMADQIALAHYDYINKANPLEQFRDKVNSIVVVADDPRAVPALAARIEAEFAHDDPPIEAMTTADFQNGLERFGQAQYVLGYVMLAIFACAALVLVSVLAHAVAERRAQMALLQVLGFSRATLFGSFAVEALFIVVIGAAIGIGAGLLILRLLPATLGQFFAGFAIPAWTWWGLPIWLAVLLAAALVIPSLTIARLRRVDVRAI